ncbi:hypothetical protein ACWGJX_42560 [Streptomyces sp. NPDC054775]
MGKSTLTVNIAAVVAENLGAAAPDGNSPVVAVGIDPQGSREKWAERVEEDSLPFDYKAASEDPGAVADLKHDPEVRRIKDVVTQRGAIGHECPGLAPLCHPLGVDLEEHRDALFSQCFHDRHNVHR